MSILDKSKSLNLDANFRLNYNDLIVNSNYKTQPIPIPKSPSTVCYSLSNSNFDNIYYFKLIVNINGREQIFSNNENKKYSNLIKNNHKIKFDELNYFKIIVNSLESTFELDGTISHKNSYYVNRSDNLFIEFSQDSNGYVNCTCYFINLDLDNLCISPPN